MSTWLSLSTKATEQKTYEITKLLPETEYTVSIDGTYNEPIEVWLTALNMDEDGIIETEVNQNNAVYVGDLENNKLTFTTQEVHTALVVRTLGVLELNTIRLEKGTIVTDWTFAPEEQEQRLSSLITQTAGEIRLEVSEIDGKVNTNTAQLQVQADEISSKVSNDDFISTISQTADGIRTEVSDEVDGLTSLITQTADGIRTEVDDEVAGLSTLISTTAGEIRQEVSDEVDGLSTLISTTAGEIRQEVDDEVAGLSTLISTTAEGIRTEVSDEVAGLSTLISTTAEGIRTEVSDEVEGLSTLISTTAEGIRTEVSDEVEGLSTRITNTAGEIRQEVSDEVDGLSSRITQTEGDIQSYVNDEVDGLSSLIAQTADGIRTEVSETYVSNDELGDYKTVVSTQFSNTSDAFNFNFNTLQTEVTNLESETGEKFTEINKYIRFVDGKIVLGEINNPFSIEISNEEIGFWQSGARVAYIKHSNLYIENSEFLQTLRIGNFEFTPRANGNLSFGKVQ